MSRTRSRLALLLLGVAAALCGAGDRVPSADAQTSDPALVSQLASAENEVLQSYMGRAPASPARSYSDGQWSASEGISCWNCYDSAATAAAVLFKQGIGGPEYERVAIETTNAAIADRQQRDGSFEGSESANAPLTTGFYAVELGIMYLELHNLLDPATASRWSAAMAAAANYLIESGQTSWYINGNVDLRQAEVMWLAWQVTGHPSFELEYEQEWAFTMAPPQARWAGFGLQLSVTPSSPDGSDGSGYLAESDGGTPGFDPEYTMAQLDTADEMYVFTRETRWLRLVNLLYNKLQPLIELTSSPVTSWELNATNGSRKNQRVTFIDPAPYLLVASGDRPELEGGLAGQFARVEHDFLASRTFTNANFYKSLADLSTPLLAEQWPSGVGASGTSEAEAPEATAPGGSPGACAPCPLAPGSLPAGESSSLLQPMTGSQGAPAKQGAPTEIGTTGVGSKRAGATRSRRTSGRSTAKHARKRSGKHAAARRRKCSSTGPGRPREAHVKRHGAVLASVVDRLKRVSCPLTRRRSRR